MNAIVREAGLQQPTHVEMVARARALVPVLRERAMQTESDRRVPDATMAAYHQADILKVLQPARFGGLEMNYLVFADIIMTLAQGCGSSAWVYSVLGEHKWVIAMYPEEAQEEVWGKDPSAASCASFAPQGKAERVPGGYKINGRWPFASGCDHAQWAIIGSFVEQKGGKPELRDFLVPIGQLEKFDDWRVLGLSGTGSKSLIAKDVFVPDHRAALHDELKAGLSAGRNVHPGWHMCRTPRSFMASFTLISAMVGMAQRTVDLFADNTRTRVSRGTKVAELDTVQLKLSEASAEVDTARLLVRTTCAENIRVLNAREEITIDRIVQTRRDMVFAVKLAKQAADRVFQASGGNALYDTSPIQHVYRDVLAASSHLFMNWELGALPYGQHRLGFPVVSPLI